MPRWILALGVAGARVVAPEIADYEVRRELIRARKTTGLARLDRLEAGLTYDPITTAAMRRTAEFWALVRQAGLPTAAPLALDADCILAAQASLLGGPEDIVTIGTANVRHVRPTEIERLAGPSAPSSAMPHSEFDLTPRISQRAERRWCMRSSPSTSLARPQCLRLHAQD